MGRGRDKAPQICRKCGAKVYWYSNPKRCRMEVYDSDFNLHTCRKLGTLKVYTEEEREEFQRKRLAGEI